MAYELIGIIKKYVGLSTDVKPAADAPKGSEFYEYDTGLTYIYNGVSWSVK